MDDDLKTSEDCPSSVASMTESPDISHVKTLDDFKTRIGPSWHRSVEGVIETGLLWAQAKKKLNRDQLVELKTTTKFSDPTVSRLICIAKDPRFTNPKYRGVLPNSYGTLYELTHLRDAEFEAAFKEGVLRPDVHREEIIAFKEKRHASGAKTKGPVLVTIWLKQETLPASELNSLQSALVALIDLPSIELTLSPTYERLVKEAQ
jgi:hypothetical protein